MQTKIAEDAKKKMQLEDQNHRIPKGLNFEAQELAFNTDLRKATISELLNCKSLIKLSTLFVILNSFNMSFSEFVSMYEEITDENALIQYEKMRSTK
ncbi:hypothetical protein ACFSKL_06830 [Belliella marina]|uniref:HTH cro/C1-type domain-containing protein n=1 Tax=Belliella marina TaxID=1644146 RepID=A0ABW4VMM0_9BACT